MNNPAIKSNRNTVTRDGILTDALCRALIIKKGVCPDRFDEPGMEDEQIRCPEHCHACCTSSATLDLTAVETLTIYLINREIIHVMDEETIQQNASGYCPFLILDKCIINAYKPTACQMYMPFAHQGKAMCAYIATGEVKQQQDCTAKYYMNSNSYAIHGLMMLVQHDLYNYLSKVCFKHIFEGVLWWKKNYTLLPLSTRVVLESVVNEEVLGLQRMDSFKFEESLLAGHQTYTDVLAGHTMYSAGRLTSCFVQAGPH